MKEVKGVFCERRRIGECDGVCDSVGRREERRGEVRGEEESTMKEGRMKMPRGK